MPDVSRLRELLALADGEEPEDTLGPPPWTVEQAAPWEARHGHDVRLGCLSVDSCAVVEELHEAAVNALPKLLDCVDLLREECDAEGHHGWMASGVKGVCWACGEVWPCWTHRSRAALASLETET